MFRDPKEISSEVFLLLVAVPKNMHVGAGGDRAQTLAAPGRGATTAEDLAIIREAATEAFSVALEGVFGEPRVGRQIPGRH